MEFSHPKANWLIPDSSTEPTACLRATHLGIGAHPDDLEFMALHGILECFECDDLWFGGVICTDGAGSARVGPYADASNEEMISIRREEQKAAAVIGQYAFMAQLAHPSAAIKERGEQRLIVSDLVAILKAAQPEVVYTHNPFDKHASHVAVLISVLDAIHHLPKDQRPKQLFGCEGWRGLDWLPDELKVIHHLDSHPELAASLFEVFQSQIVGGKRYDFAVDGRHRANATFLDSHSVDEAERVSYAVDLTELMGTGTEGLAAYVNEVIRRFRASILV